MDLVTDHAASAGRPGVDAAQLEARAGQVRIDPAHGATLASSSGLSPFAEVDGQASSGGTSYLPLEPRDTVVGALDEDSVMDARFGAATRLVVVASWDHPWAQVEALARRGHGSIHSLPHGQGEWDLVPILPAGYEVLVHRGTRSAVVLAVNGRPAASVPFVGVAGGPDAEGDGLVVEEVTTGSPAAAAGIGVGDVILTADGQPIRHLVDLARMAGAHQVDDQVSVVVRREGSTVTLVVRLAAHPS